MSTADARSYLSTHVTTLGVYSAEVSLVASTATVDQVQLVEESPQIALEGPRRILARIPHLDAAPSDNMPSSGLSSSSRPPISQEPSSESGQTESLSADQDATESKLRIALSAWQFSKVSPKWVLGGLVVLVVVSCVMLVRSREENSVQLPTASQETESLDPLQDQSKIAQQDLEFSKLETEPVDSPASMSSAVADSQAKSIDRPTRFSSDNPSLQSPLDPDRSQQADLYREPSDLSSRQRYLPAAANSDFRNRHTPQRDRWSGGRNGREFPSSNGDRSIADMPVDASRTDSSSIPKMRRPNVQRNRFALDEPYRSSSDSSRSDQYGRNRNGLQREEEYRMSDQRGRASNARFDGTIGKPRQDYRNY